MFTQDRPWILLQATRIYSTPPHYIPYIFNIIFEPTTDPPRGFYFWLLDGNWMHNSEFLPI
jgi:hypothetical protein